LPRHIIDFKYFSAVFSAEKQFGPVEINQARWVIIHFAVLRIGS